MKKRLMKLLKTKQEQRDNLNAAMIEAETREERAAIGETLRKIADEIAELEAALAEVDEPAGAGEGESAGEGSRSGEGRELILGGHEARGAGAQGETDPRDTPEYRNAFMNFVCRGVPIPAEMRATTTTADGAAVIPTTTLNEIIRELKSYGEIFNKVRRLHIQGGVEIPILDLIPTATWIGETSGSDANKVGAKETVSFKYFGIECKIAQTLLTEVVTYAAFQDLFVPLAVEAVVKGVEIALVSGDGKNKPLGVTVDSRIPEANIITLSPSDVASWNGWKKKVFGKMKKSYRKGEFVMAQATFDGYIDGMEDKNGQPIGRVTYGIDGGEIYRFGGKTVMTVEDDIILPYEAAAEGDVVAIFVDWSKYGLNTNLEFKTVKWTDHDTNEVKTKVILICDGKLIDPYGVLIIKKGA